MILSSQATTQISSLPSRERGLKSCFVDVNKIVSNVAPLAGAWIEIDRWHKDRMERLSLPSRERGLKLIRYSSGSIRRLSLPSRERGLKYPILDSLYLCLVAPLVGAWIEIDMTHVGGESFLSRPSRERGLKFCAAGSYCVYRGRSPSRERGLKFLHLMGVCCNPSRSPRRSAD